MRKLLSLVRVGLSANFGFSVLRYRVFQEKKDIWLIPVFVLAFASLLPLLFVYLKLIRVAYGLLSPLSQQSLILMFAIMVAQVFVLVFGLYYVVAAFYFSRDLEILIPLPLKPLQVLLSKFVVILVNEYLTLLPLLLPALVYFGILAKAGPGYWMQSLIVYALLPVIPLAIVSVFVIALMRVVNLSRKKDLLIIVGSLLMIPMALGLQLAIGRSAGSTDIERTIRMLASHDGLLNRIGGAFPPSIWATKAIAGGLSISGMTNLLLLAGVSLILLYLILVMAKKLFYGGLIGISEVSGVSRTLSEKGISRLIASRGSPVRAIFMRELRIMNRTPVFVLNGIGAVVLIPIVLLLTPHMGKRADTSFLNVFTSINPSWVILGMACFLTVCASLNGTASSTFSREGSQFWMSKVIPVSPQKQVIAKFLHSYIVALLGIAFASATIFGGNLLGVIFLSFSLRPTTWIAALVLALLASFALTAIGMIIDLARPLLDWTNPQKAIKQNLNVLLAILIDVGIIALLGWFSSALVRRGLGTTAVVAILLTVLVLFSLAVFWLLLRFALKRYIEIEV